MQVRLLTDCLDDFRQEDAIRDVMLQIGDELVVAGLLQVMVGPVHIDLQPTNQPTNQSRRS